MNDEHSGFVVIPPELLAKATPEEREAYFQYLLGRVIEADEWEPWIKMLFPATADRPFSAGHKEFWEWVWSVKPGSRPRPWVSIWPRGHGKRLASRTPILTTSGWSTQGDLKTGDVVFGPDGEPTKVTWVGPETQRPLYRVRFTDGTELLADPEHEWTVLDRGSYEWRTLETQQIAAQRYRTGDHPRFMLPYRGALSGTERELPIDPYLLGYWLGDGNAKTGVLAAGAIDDANEVALVIEASGELIKNRFTQSNTGCNYIIVDGLRRRLNDLDLLGNKHIPDSYFTSSLDQRRALMAGLVDSDGHVDQKRGQVRFVSRSKRLAEAVRLLARTLGYNATLWSEVDERDPRPVTDLNGDITMAPTAGTRWVASWAPHDGAPQGCLTRKSVEVLGRRERVGVESIEPVNPEPGLCIEVDREDGLYLAGKDLIPTHNSTSSELAVVALAARRKRRYGIYVSETQDQADDHVANVAAMLESPAIELAYPDLGERLMGKFGTSKGWRRNRIRTKTGFTLDAMGLDSAARGVKLEDQRPDLMCHEVGTPIRDGNWSGLVENHPGLLGLREADGKKVTVSGIPYPEVVTNEHRYYAKLFVSQARDRHLEEEAGWVEAQDLTLHHYIGTPIDMSIEPPPPVEKYAPGAVLDRDDSGRITSSRGAFEEFHPAEFTDSEWWWFFGLWWGDGYLAGNHQVGVTIANTQLELMDRVSALLTRAGIAFTTSSRVGCHQILFCNAWMNRWLRSWKYEIEGESGHGLKCPPPWVERLPLEWQASLMRGYVDADGYVSASEVKITSVSYRGLLSAKRILVRLGIAASIRDLRPARHMAISGVQTRGKRTFDLRFGQGREALGFEPLTPPRYRFAGTFISDGWLWHKVRSIEEVKGRKFAPINVGGDHTYLTDIGLSHNCFDDIDGELDTDERVEKKIKTITRKLLPAGAQDCAILMVQNLVHENSIFARLADGRADFLRDRIVSGPIPAIWDLEYEELEGKFVITGGKPSWPEGFPIDSCQLLMNDIGLSAFLAECQHETKPPEGDIFNHIAFTRVEHAHVPRLQRAVVWVDPAVTSSDSSDSMGIQCDGLGVDGKIYRLFSWENRSTPYRAIRLAVEKALEFGADTVGVETNQGGDLWRVVYDQACEDIRVETGDRYMKMPRYRQEKATADLGPKITRAERMLVDYERGLFVHVEGTHHTLEMALRRFPKVKPFDLVDAAYWSWAFLAGPMHRRKAKVRSSAKKYLRASMGIGNAPVGSMIG